MEQGSTEQREYTYKNGQRLRLGRTTGSCAALAARAAALRLLDGSWPQTTRITTPGGTCIEAPVLEPAHGQDWAQCAVRKDAGDDPDVTDGVLVCARVACTSEKGISIDGGEGVGRVTRPGLDQPPGAAAINSTPRAMIADALQAVCQQYGYAGGLDVIISIPGGRELAARTFNPHLGIEGGLSVIGTSGIVEPASTRAVVDTIAVEMRMRQAAGQKYLLAAPGRYGLDYARRHPRLQHARPLQCANFVGETIDLAASMGFAGVLFVSHAGKFVKIAGGVMDTHSQTADARTDVLALHTGLAGGPQWLMRAVLECAAVDEALELLHPAGLLDGTVQSLLSRAQWYLARRAGPGLRVGAVVFSSAFGELGMTPGAEELVARLEEENG